MTRWSSAAFALLFALAAPGARGAPAAKHEFENPCMGTLFRVVIYTEQPGAKVKAAADAAFALAADLDACLSDYRADSEVGRFHRSTPGEPQPVSETLADILAKSQCLRDATDAAFDPARGALTRLWRMARRTGELPSASDLAAARKASGLSQLEFNPETRTLTRRSNLTRLDFGGIAKGYAADAMYILLRDRGFPSASIAAGGDVRCGDPPPGQPGWTVAIRPSGDRAPAVLTLCVSNAAVSTSGSVEQGIEIGGQRYSHIIDPATGLGMTTQRAATVIAPSATESDALATALCVFGGAGLPEIEDRSGCAAAIFSPPGSTPDAKTANFGALLTAE